MALARLKKASAKAYLHAAENKGNDWVVEYDVDNSKYYRNTVTNETSWDNPFVKTEITGSTLKKKAKMQFNSGLYEEAIETYEKILNDPKLLYRVETGGGGNNTLKSAIKALNNIKEHQRKVDGDDMTRLVGGAEEGKHRGKPQASKSKRSPMHMTKSLPSSPVKLDSMDKDGKEDVLQTLLAEMRAMKKSIANLKEDKPPKFSPVKGILKKRLKVIKAPARDLRQKQKQRVERKRPKNRNNRRKRRSVTFEKGTRGNLSDEEEMFHFDDEQKEGSNGAREYRSDDFMSIKIFPDQEHEDSDSYRRERDKVSSPIVEVGVDEPSIILGPEMGQKRYGNYDPFQGNGGGVFGELRNLREEVQRIRMRTLYEMVNEVQVTTRAGPRTKNVVWLTSPQVHMFQKDTLQRLLQALEIKRAPNLVIMVKPSLYCKAMIKNSGQRFSTRVKFGVRQYDIELLDGSAVSTPSQAGLRIRTKGPARSMSGVSTEGQLLGCSHDGSSSTVLADTPVVDEDLLDKLVAPNREDMEETDRKICMYVSEVLMPIIVNTSAIVITYGTNNCSFTVALGEAFNKLPVNAQVGTPGFNCPRLLGIVSFPNVAASAIRPGNNAHGILEATQQEEAARAMLPHSLSSSCFVDEDYQEFLKKVNGADKEDWMQYDLVPGLTDVIMVDSRNPEMDCQDKTPVRHLVATFERVFAGTIPTLSIFYGAASGRLDYHGIISALSQG
eukprot:g456.t1